MFYHQPLYEFSKWAFQMGIKSNKGCNLKEFSKKNLDEKTIEEFVEVNSLRYYNYDMHLGAFAQTPAIKELLRSE